MQRSKIRLPYLHVHLKLTEELYAVFFTLTFYLSFLVIYVHYKTNKSVILKEITW